MSFSQARHNHKKWKQIDGKRFAVPCARGTADLMSTVIKNKTGSQVVRYVMLDIDFKRTISKYKDSNEKHIVWHRVFEEIQKIHPTLAQYIEYITLSTSGTGIHIILGVTPLPLYNKSIAAQKMLKKTQSEIIQLLNELGIGADENSRGLVRDFCTFRKDSNLLFKNELLTERLEKSAKLLSYEDAYGNKVTPTKTNRITPIQDLSTSTDRILRKMSIKGGYRLYRDSRVEPAFAKLFLFAFGTPLDDCPVQKPCMYGTSKNSFELTSEELELITGKDRRNFANYRLTDEFRALFECEKISGTFEEGIFKLSLKESGNMKRRIDRARIAANQNRTKMEINLIEPHLVDEDSRNSAIFNWGLALKFSGVSREVCLAKLVELSKQIPGFETSRNCRLSQLRSTVNSLYNNRAETHGAEFEKELPHWLQVHNVQMQSPMEAAAKPLILSSTTKSSRRIQGVLLEQGFDSIHEVNKEIGKSFEKEETSNLLFQSVPAKLNLTVVSFDKRIGFFIDKKLILNLKHSRHYKLQKVVEHIEKNILHEKIWKVSHKRHNCKDYRKYADQLYTNDTYALKAEQICGRKADRAISIDEFKRKKLEREMNASVSFEEFTQMHAEAPLFDYAESMFTE